MESFELLYDATWRITGVVEYGVSLEAITSGKATPPPEGARFDISIEGSVNGPKLKGSSRGIDYLNIRADGVPELHIHGLFDLADGGKVSVFADGVAPVDANGIAHLRENITLKSNYPAYAWVNSTVVWGVGTVKLATGELRLKGYKA